MELKNRSNWHLWVQSR